MKRGCIPLVLIWTFLLSTGVFLAACGETPEQEDHNVQLPLPDNAVAQVNQTVLYDADVQREALAQRVIEEGGHLGSDDEAYERILEELIDQRLLAIEARERGLQNSPEARRRLAAAEERILGNILLETEIAAQVTEDAARELYATQTTLARPSDQIRARHILVDSQAAADAVIGLYEDGRDFAELAVQYSQDIATSRQGGDLGYFTSDGVLPEISSLAFSTPEGELAGPVQTQSGWHVLLIEDRRAPDSPPFEEMQASITRFLTFEAISNLVDGLREQARIDIDLPQPDPAIPERVDDELVESEMTEAEDY